jgi:solute carrier family 35 protein F5
VVVLWVLSSFLLNNLFEQGIYSKPFLITWFNTASFSFYLIPYYLNQKNNNQQIEYDNDSNLLISPDNENLIGIHNYENPSSDTLIISSSELNNKLHPLTFKETLKLSFFFCILWFTSNFFNNTSLLFTSVSSQTILSSTSSFFTLLIGYFFDQETFNLTKILSLIGLLIGVICVTLNDNPQTSDSSPFQLILIGDIFALLGAFCYGIYSILLKLKVKDDSRMDMKLFFGFVGIFNTFLLWPFLIIAHYSKIETFQLPPTKSVWLIILFNCAISFLADFLWARAMLLTSPLTVTVGLCLTIPLALICDVIFKFKINSPIYFFGAFLVCFSFYWINKHEMND